jgi:glycosyltransferase involved in cell wall biosynthesis
MRIAVVNRHPSVALGGSETQCDLIARRLARRHDVLYVAPDGVAAAARPYRTAAVRDRPAAILAAIRDHRPDVVYWRYGLRHLGRVGPALRRGGTPFVFASSHEHDLVRGAIAAIPSDAGARARILHVRDRIRAVRDHRGLAAASAVVVNSADHLGLTTVAPRIHIPNGVDPASEPFTWPRPYVAWVANLKPEKRPEACIPLAAGIADLGVDVLMAGRPQVHAYERFGTRPDLPSNLHVLGPLPAPEAAGLLAGALLHVHTCRPEGFPNVFLQAWRAGVPSVSLGYDPSGTIGRERLGAVSGDDSARFVTDVRALLVDAGARAAAGSRAAAHVRSHADPDRAAEQLEAFLGTVLAASAGRPR